MFLVLCIHVLYSVSSSVICLLFDLFCVDTDCKFPGKCKNITMWPSIAHVVCFFYVVHFDERKWSSWQDPLSSFFKMSKFKDTWSSLQGVPCVVLFVQWKYRAHGLQWFCCSFKIALISFPCFFWWCTLSWADVKFDPLSSPVLLFCFFEYCNIWRCTLQRRCKVVPDIIGIFYDWK